MKILLDRILGNDLYPRHGKTQTLNNLRFILENEGAFEDVEKRWILNRIVDKENEKKIIALLESFSQNYRRIPFDQHACKAIPKHDFNARLAGIIGLNNARNMALREGKKAATWVLPFGGNCFFTSGGWSKLVADVAGHPECKCVVVPMIRVVDNERFDEIAKRKEPAQETDDTLSKIGVYTEPQIMFRHDSEDEYDEACQYEEFSKVNLLWRIGMPGEWDSWRSGAKEQALAKRSKDFGKYIVAGYVWRLHSGNRKAELSLGKRTDLRNLSIRYLLDKVEHGPVVGAALLYKGLAKLYCFKVVRKLKKIFGLLREVPQPGKSVEKQGA